MSALTYVLTAIAVLLCARPISGIEPQPLNAPLDQDERLLSALNCGLEDAPSGWKPVAQWTVPGRFPLTTSLRAYHAASFGSGRMNVDYMVCHLGWYSSREVAADAFREGIPLVGSRGEEIGTFGEQATLYLGDGKLAAFGSNPQQNTYQVTIRRGLLLFAAGIVTTQTWDRERLEGFGRAIDERFRSHRLEIDTADGPPRLLREKLKEPSRAPACTQKCWIHDKKFEAVLLPTGGGLPGGVAGPAAFGIGVPGTGTEEQGKAKREYWDARQRLFPNAAPRFIDVGCIHDPLHDEDWACACSACTAAEKAWRTEHKVPAD
jgi:hypothetical protein